MRVAESLLEHMKISVSDDGTRAYLTNDALAEDASITEDDLVQFLQEKGIVFGVKDGLVVAQAASAAHRTPVLVAQGIEPVSGNDGWVESLIDVRKLEAMEEKGGRVNLHNLHRIHNVKKGEQLAVIHPPSEGTSGISVRGGPIAAKPGKRPKIYRGACVAPDPDNADILLATDDGNLMMKSDGTIEVQPVLTIRGDIDFSTGDIDFVGSLIVTGDIKSDFSVKVQKNLEVRGNAGDSTIVAGGNVLIKNGFLGRGKGSVMAGGNVTIQHVLNQSVTSEQKVIIQSEAVCAKINAADAIASPKARFVGCTLRAGNEIEVFNLGNGDDTQAIVHVGRRAELLEKYSTLVTGLEQFNRQAAEIRDYVYKLVRLQLDAPLTEEQTAFLEKLKKLQADLPVTALNLAKEKADIEAALQAAGSARVVVKGTVYMNVLLDINGVKKLMQSALKEVQFVEIGGKVEEQSTPAS
jgi:uncharacterized protein